MTINIKIKKMKSSNYSKILMTCLIVAMSFQSFAQRVEREWHIKRGQPKEWGSLAPGARFMDRFLPIPVVGELRSDVWGSSNVLPRYTYDGIEDDERQYWGGNIQKGDDGKFHLIVCGWIEETDSHWERTSRIIHAVSDNSMGPYKINNKNIGPGHNPEYYRLKDGRYIIYIRGGGGFIADDIYGPWKEKKFEYDPRDRRIIEGLSNFSFAQREDGSFLGICRGGGIWVSKTGESKYMQVTNKSNYPTFVGEFEDPVIWRTNIQYHMIVNDWYGRVAYHLRSKDGFSWKLEPGEAYTPGISKYEDGTNVEWYKYERIKVLQDEYGRAYQANFGVTGITKFANFANDQHSTKNHCIPLTKGKLISLVNKEKITSKTKTIKLKVLAEDGFNPQTDIDLESLKFGASEFVNYGGGCTVHSTKKDGKDLIITFNANGRNGFTDANFAGKLLGKTIDGKLLFGYTRLPWVNYNESVLSAKKPKVTDEKNRRIIEFEVQNFGQVRSDSTSVNLEFTKGYVIFTINTKVNPLKPYEKTIVKVNTTNLSENLENYEVRIYTENSEQELLLLE